MFRMYFACKYQPRWFYSTVGWEGVHAAVRGVLLQPVTCARCQSNTSELLLLLAGQSSRVVLGSRDRRSPAPSELLGRAGTSVPHVALILLTFSRGIKVWGS